MEESKKFKNLLSFSEMETNSGILSMEKQYGSPSLDSDFKNDNVKGSQNDDNLKLPRSYCWSFEERSPIYSHQTYTINQTNKFAETEKFGTSESLCVNISDPEQHIPDHRNYSFNYEYPPDYLVSNVERKYPFKDYKNTTEVQLQNGLFSMKRERLSAVDNPRFLMKEKDKYSEMVSGDVIERISPSDIKHVNIRQGGEHIAMDKISFNDSNHLKESKSIHPTYGNRLESTVQSKDSKNNRTTSQNRGNLSNFWWLKNKNECDDKNSKYESALKFKKPFLCPDKILIEPERNIMKLKFHNKVHDKYNEVFNQPSSTSDCENQQNPEYKPVKSHSANENELFQINSCGRKWWKNVKKINLPDTPYGVRENNFEKIVKQVLGSMCKNDNILVEKNDLIEVKMGCDLKINDALTKDLDKKYKEFDKTNFKSNIDAQSFIEDDKQIRFKEIEGRNLPSLLTTKVNVKNEISLANKQSCELEPDTIHCEQINEVTVNDSFSNQFNHILEYSYVNEENNQEKVDETFGLIHNKQKKIISGSLFGIAENNITDIKFSSNAHDVMLKRIKPIIKEEKANKENFKVEDIMEKEPVAKANEMNGKEKIINVENKGKAEVLLVEEKQSLLYENSSEKGKMLTCTENENNIKYDAILRNTGNKIVCDKDNLKINTHNKQEKSMSMVVNTVNNPVAMVGKIEEANLELFKVKEYNNLVSQLNETEVCLGPKITLVEDNETSSVEKCRNEIKEQEKNLEGKIFESENIKTDDEHKNECCKRAANHGLAKLATAEIAVQHNEFALESAVTLSKKNIKEDEEKCCHHIDVRIDDTINKELDSVDVNEERILESVMYESSKNKNDSISLEKSGNSFTDLELGKSLIFDKIEAEVIISQIKDGKTSVQSPLEKMNVSSNRKEDIFIFGENRMQMINNITMVNKAFNVKNCLENKECDKNLDQKNNVLVKYQSERISPINDFGENKHSVIGKQENKVKCENEAIMSKEAFPNSHISRADVEIDPEIQSFVTEGIHTKTLDIPLAFSKSVIFLPQDSFKGKPEVQFSENLTQPSKMEEKEVKSLNIFSTMCTDNRLTVEPVKYGQNEIIEKEISSSILGVETDLLNHDSMKLSLKHEQEIFTEIGTVINNDDTSIQFYANENVELKIDNNEMLSQINSCCSTFGEFKESIFPEEKIDYFEDAAVSFYCSKNDNPCLESFDMAERLMLDISSKKIHCNEPRSTKKVVVFDNTVSSENITEKTINFSKFFEVFEWNSFFKHNDVDFTILKINLVNIRQKGNVEEIDENSYKDCEKQKIEILPEHENKLMDFNDTVCVARGKTLLTLDDIIVKDIMLEGREVGDETSKSPRSTLNDSHIFELNGTLGHYNNNLELTRPIKLGKKLQDDINEWSIIDDSYTDCIMKDLDTIPIEYNIDHNDSDQYDCDQNDMIDQWRSHSKKKKSFFESNNYELDWNKNKHKCYYDEKVENHDHEEKDLSTLENKISTLDEECCTNEIVFELPKFEVDSIVMTKENNYDGSVIAESSSESLKIISPKFSVEESDVQILDERQKTEISDDTFHNNRTFDCVDENVDDISLDEYLDSILEKHLEAENKKCPSDSSSAVRPLHSNVECQTQLEGLMFSFHTSQCMENLFCSGNKFEICNINGRKRHLEALNLEETKNKRFKIFYGSIYNAQYENIYDSNNSVVKNDQSKDVLLPTENVVGNVKEIIETESKEALQLEEQNWDDILDDKLIKRGTNDQKVPEVELQEINEEKPTKRKWVNSKNPETEVGVREVPSVPANTSRNQSVLRLGLSKRAKLPRLHYV